jgi:hypothetical protein
MADAQDHENPDSLSNGPAARRDAVTETVLDCLRGQQTMTDRVLTCLSGEHAISEQLQRRVDALESQVASLADRLQAAGVLAPQDAAAIASLAADATPPEADAPPEAAATPPDAAVAAQPDAPRPPAPSPPPSGARRRGTVARLPFVGKARSCAVCRLSSPRQTKRELVRAGWTITGHWGVCPGCRSAGWRLDDAAGLPFRQGPVVEE